MASLPDDPILNAIVADWMPIAGMAALVWTGLKMAWNIGRYGREIEARLEKIEAALAGMDKAIQGGHGCVNFNAAHDDLKR